MSKLKVKLIPGKEYLFTHKRKPTFRALYRGIVRAPGTDAQDEYYFKCEIGSPQREINIRPSLITIVQDVPQHAPPVQMTRSSLRAAVDDNPGGERVRKYYQHFKSFIRSLRK